MMVFYMVMICETETWRLDQTRNRNGLGLGQDMTHVTDTSLKTADMDMLGTRQLFYR